MSDEVVKKLDEILRALKEIHSTLLEIQYTLETQQPKTQTRYKTKKKKGASMMEIAKEKEVQFLSQIKPSNPRAFINKAEEIGLVVIEGKNDTAIVHPEAFERFTEKIGLATDIDQLKDDKPIYRLTAFLLKEGYLKYKRGEGFEIKEPLVVIIEGKKKEEVSDDSWYDELEALGEIT